MKKRLSFILALAFCLTILAGCSSGGTSGGSGTATPPPADSGDASDLTQGKSYTINIASTFPAEGFVNEGMETFKEYIQEKTGGRVEVVVHPAGALGSTREICEGLSAGTIEMGAYGDEDIDYYCPQYSVFSVPYLFRDAQHYFDFFDTYGDWIFGEIQKECGIMTGTWFYRGARDITANKKIMEPEDLAGLKFRLPSTPIRVAVFEAYGASPTIVDFSELYMALKTGTADAQENPPETIYSYKYYEAQKYLILSGHIQTLGRYTISEAWFNTLSAADQDLIMEAWAYTHDEIMKNYSDPDKEYIDKCVEAGMELVTPNVERFIELAKPVVEKWAEDNWEPTLWEKINSL
ncbi:TRAP transporter substrate-binding protein [uncultured Oscillibacter sp.]|uniref:TRAP transporter substrate-binding protein n=1 Tax=uncultured Oscillibacter sp. TaxID=876091 RepID=UPI002804B9BC|nr:TRAP transporter substrate-binding protein [uncultured Oscillibacter sp.]